MKEHQMTREIKKNRKEENMKELQSVYNQIANILKENNVLMNITPPRPYLIKKEDEERINAEAASLLKEGKVEEYYSKMEEKEAYKLYYDEAFKYTNFYEEGGENIQYYQRYRKDNIIIEQYCLEWADAFTLTAGDYKVGPVTPQPAREWLAQGYKQIDVDELLDELKARGYEDEW